MRRWHLALGIAMVAAFVGSGAYMRFGAGLSDLTGERHLLFISRHIYMLGPALVHLLLAVYLRPVAREDVPRLQWAGTVLLALTSALLVTAFVTEAMAGRGRTAVSSFGIYTFGAGTILHVIAPAVSRRLAAREP